MDSRKARTVIGVGRPAGRTTTAVRPALRIPRQKPPQAPPEQVLPDETLLAEATEAAQAEPPHELTVIVPTRNESGNVAPLLDRLAGALAGRSVRVLFVDDSDDDTPQQVTRAAARSPLSVGLIHRPVHHRHGGLGGAVLAGLRETASPWAVVMDGDLQHPPELVPQLVDAGVQGEADVVVASRHVPGGSTDGLSNGVRVLVSDLSTKVTKAFFPHRLRGISDPMSGFFALRPAAFELDRMHPHGFKILLEMVARTPGLTKTEVPFVFAERLCGNSKASVLEGLRFVGQLVALSVSRLRPRGRSTAVSRGAGFAAVGATGMVVNLGFTWLLADPVALGLNYLVAAAVATQLSSSWNFALTDGLVYRGPKRYTRLVRWAGFMAMSNAVLLARIPLLALLVTVLGVHYLVATAVTLLLGFLVRFRSQERLTLSEEMA